jgi:triacylglycerol lipase
MGVRRSRKAHRVQQERRAVPLPIWSELLVGVELVFLRISPVYWGCGIPRGDGSAVVLVPGFLGSDFYLGAFRSWLRRIGYRTYNSGIGLNAECPNLLIRQYLNAAVQKAYRTTGRKVHLIGHSLGGTIALSAASQMPDRIASVTTLGSPLCGLSCHPSILQMADLVRERILAEHGDGVLPECYTGACTCDFVEALSGKVPKSVLQTAVYTKADGIVDWHVCRTNDPDIDFEVSATHIGLVFSPLVYSIVAERLAGA